MKKLILALLMLGICSYAYAAEYRVQIDVLFTQEADAVALINYFETLKAKTYAPKVSDKYTIPRQAQMIDSWDTGENPKPGITRINVDFNTPAVVHAVANRKVDVKEIVDKYRKEIDDEIRKLERKKKALRQKEIEWEGMED